MDKLTITSGKYRGRKILAPGSGTHPMGSRERLALFNMLGESLIGADVLDVFAGSGALGIEALSRGASNVVFVDKSAKVTNRIKENLHTLGIEKEAEVFCTSASKVADALGDYRFDLIFADPPYNDVSVEQFSSLADLLKKNGVFVLSHPEVAPELPGLTLTKTRQYAAAHISLYLRNKAV